MTRRLSWIMACAAVALGLGHLSLGALVFRQASMEALWFTGSGLAIVLGGLVNLFALVGSHGRTGRTLLVAANVATLGFFLFAWLVVPEPQVMVGLVLFAGLTALAAFGNPPTRTGSS